ncbi:MAG: J domain-containing protein [Gammaproteobacteria bacterium]
MLNRLLNRFFNYLPQIFIFPQRVLVNFWLAIRKNANTPDKERKTDAHFFANLQLLNLAGLLLLGIPSGPTGFVWIAAEVGAAYWLSMRSKSYFNQFLSTLCLLPLHGLNQVRASYQFVKEFYQDFRRASPDDFRVKSLIKAFSLYFNLNILLQFSKDINDRNKALKMISLLKSSHAVAKVLNFKMPILKKSRIDTLSLSEHIQNRFEYEYEDTNDMLKFFKEWIIDIEQLSQPQRCEKYGLASTFNAVLDERERRRKEEAEKAERQRRAQEEAERQRRAQEEAERQRQQEAQRRRQHHYQHHWQKPSFFEDFFRNFYNGSQLQQFGKNEVRESCDILKIDIQSTFSDAKKSYYKLAKQYHPDKNPNNAAAEEQFKKVNEAYHYLENHSFEWERERAKNSTTQTPYRQQRYG